MRPGWLLGGHNLRDLYAIAIGVEPELVITRRTGMPWVSQPPPDPAEFVSTAPDINHPRALLPAWQAEAERLQELLDRHGQFTEDQPADVPTAVLLTRMRVLDEVRGQLTRRLEWSGMLDP